jgi:hypothetical protein
MKRHDRRPEPQTFSTPREPLQHRRVILSEACAIAPQSERPGSISSCKSSIQAASRYATEHDMTSLENALRLPKAQTRAMRVSVTEAERQLIFSLWLVALLVAATAVTATVGLIA